jgi:hypothetical protein
MSYTTFIVFITSYVRWMLLTTLYFPIKHAMPQHEKTSLD